MNSDSEIADSDSEGLISDYENMSEDDEDSSQFEPGTSANSDEDSEEGEPEVEGSDNTNSENDSAESEIESDLDNDDNFDPTFTYSSQNAKDESYYEERAQVVRAKLALCEKLLETRIKLQKPMLIANQLPRPEVFEEMEMQCDDEEKQTLTNCREAFTDMLEMLIGFQCKYRSMCPEFLNTLDETSRKEYEEYANFDGTVRKRRSIKEYSALLPKLHDQYTPYMNSVLQEWTDKSRIASGRFARKDFSAFDVPVAKQIEDALADRNRLIQKTKIKRSDYKIIGEEDTNDVEQNEETRETSQAINEYIFDDDDFYHKLLRDYIERKTADETDPTQLGRKWIKLQSLRNKMKRKIDTRRTKERKIKLNIHNKLVNYMAPITTNAWTDNATNELYSSVFGKNLINS